jgi:hypothetical protein
MDCVLFVGFNCFQNSVAHEGRIFCARRRKATESYRFYLFASADKFSKLAPSLKRRPCTTEKRAKTGHSLNHNPKQTEKEAAWNC